MILSCTVYGKAQTQGSKRIGRARGTGKPIILDDSAKSRPFRQEVAHAMLAAAKAAGLERPMDGAVAVTLMVSVARPLSHYGTGKRSGILKPSAPVHPATGGDLDKIARLVLDAGTGIWWKDDRRIARLDISRLYDGPERIEVRAWQL